MLFIETIIVCGGFDLQPKRKILVKMKNNMFKYEDVYYVCIYIY